MTKALSKSNKNMCVRFSLSLKIPTYSNNAHQEKKILQRRKTFLSAGEEEEDDEVGVSFYLKIKIL